MKQLYSFIAGKPGRIAALDGLRAMAITLVLFRHGVKAYEEQFPENFSYVKNSPFFTLMLNGWVGVDLFFVLSGFLIGYHLLSQWPKTRESKLIFFAKYWLKRLLRTFPLYYAVLIIILLGLIPMYSHQSVNVSNDLITHLLFLQDYNGAAFLVPLWSLATEEKFYFICPFLIWCLCSLLKRWKSAVLLLLVLSLMPLFWRLLALERFDIINYSSFFWNIRAPFHMALDGLLLGLLVAFLYSNSLLNDLIRCHWKYLFWGSTSVLLLALMVKEWMENVGRWEQTALIVLAFSALFACLLYSSIYAAGKIYTVLSSVCFRFVSKLSYSLYLSHMLVIPLSTYFSFQVEEAYNHHLYYILSFVVSFIVLSFILSIMLHIFVERPFLLLKDKVEL